jgi:hypothetical protein
MITMSISRGGIMLRRYFTSEGSWTIELEYQFDDFEEG